MVLPRPLRRAVRFLVSLGTGRIHFAPHTGTVSALAFFAATGFYGMSLGGHSQDFAQATTTAAGFAIEDVKVSGNARPRKSISCSSSALMARRRWWRSNRCRAAS